MIVPGSDRARIVAWLHGFGWDAAHIAASLDESEAAVRRHLGVQSEHAFERATGERPARRAGAASVRVP